MAKKGEVLFWMFMIGMYGFAFSLSPLMSFTQGLRKTEPGHLPDPEDLELASKWETGYFASAGVYFVFVAIFWTLSYFSTWKLANRYPRLNIKLVFESRYSKLFMGLGITSPPKEMKGSSIEVLNALSSAGLIKVFNEIKEEIEKKFHGKQAVEKPTGETKVSKKGEPKTITFTIDDLKKEDLNFETFPIEMLHKKDWECFFEKAEIDFFKTVGTKDTKEFLALNHAEIELLKAKYYKQFSKVTDIGYTQILLKKCLEYLNTDQVKFLKSMNVHNIQDLLDSDLEKLNAKYNDQFIKPKAGLLQNFVALLNAPGVALKKVDFKDVIMYMVKDLIAKEKNFVVDIDKEEYMKYVTVKVNRVRSMFPDKRAYLVQFDGALEIPSETPEFDFYKQREMDDPMTEDGEIDIDSKNVRIKQVLVLTPVAWNDCFVYHAGEIDDFNGHAVDCNQITDVVCRYRGMLTSEICVIEIRSCDWSVNYSAVDTIEWTNEEMYNVNMAAMYQLLRDMMVVQEDIKKNLETEKARVERKDKELDKMWAKKWADTTPDAATKRLLRVEQKPVNAFVAVIIVVIGIVFLFLGVVLGIFLYPWIGAAFNLPEAEESTRAIIGVLSSQLTLFG